MHRFFINEDCITQSTVAIPGKLVHRLRNVLRLRAGDHIVVLDNSGWEYEVELGEASGSGLKGLIVAKALAVGEPRTSITLYQALLKGSSFDLVLQKCTEIGVTSFVHVVCERCVAGDPDSSRLSRWQKIILEAAQQSRRGKLPVLRPVIPFSEACETAMGLSLLPWEGETTRGIGDVLRVNSQVETPPEVSIFVGSEGGFTTDEVELARSHGITPVSLGSRILRAETAGLIAAAITLYEFSSK